MKEGKMVIFSAPSGAGKTTIVSYLLSRGLNFRFPVSATTRRPRGTEQNDKVYDFLNEQEFRNKIEHEEFLEWEEVCPGYFYGTLKSEVERICKNGQNVLFDVDIEGGRHIKKYYGDKALAIFIQPPSVQNLKSSSIVQSADCIEVMNTRIEKAEHEIPDIEFFDVIINNDQLEDALKVAEEKVSQFLAKS